MVGGGDEERLIDSGMVHVVSDGGKQGRHDFQGLHMIADLNKLNKYKIPVRILPDFYTSPVMENSIFHYTGTLLNNEFFFLPGTSFSYVEEFCNLLPRFDT